MPQTASALVAPSSAHRPVRMAVLGAGAWGTAIAVAAARRAGPEGSVLLWGRDAAQLEAMRRTRRNVRYLGDVELPASLTLTSDRDEALRHVRGGGAAAPGLLIVGTPMAALRETLAALAAEVAGCGVLWLCKGFEAGSGLLGHEVAAQVMPGLPCGVLSGPSFAAEVVRGQPTALVAASTDAFVRELAVQALHGESLRIYTSEDPIGVEVGGAVKNVLAIATGIADGMELGLNARAALITRGLAEMTRLGVALGAQAETFMGLSGLGDLVLTATGSLSRNRQVGLQLAAGRSLPDILADLGHVAEGVYSAATVLQRARSRSVDMPLTEAVVGVLEGRLQPAQALLQLMRREARAEG